MDIVTHGMMGVALAGPLLGTHPAGAAGFILGSVAPDLDAFSRCFGKRAFLRCHQGMTHSLPVIAAVAASGYAAAHRLEPEGAGFFIGAGLGAALHLLFDLTNTYGVHALWPFSYRRFCWEWIFFIDAGILLLTAPAALIAVATLGRADPSGRIVSIVYGAALAAYVAVRAGFRRLAAKRLAPGVVSMIPAALWPWEFFICSRPEEADDRPFVRISKINALTGRQISLAELPIYDALVRSQLERLPEFAAMVELTPAYHIVRCEQDGELVRVACRDLRTVNFNTNFGALHVVLNSRQDVLSTTWHV
jgi:membrane-bound metal-dependent hydrolase YbcI (DUF457 family)